MRAKIYMTILIKVKGNYHEKSYDTTLDIYRAQLLWEHTEIAYHLTYLYDGDMRTLYQTQHEVKYIASNICKSLVYWHMRAIEFLPGDSTLSYD